MLFLGIASPGIANSDRVVVEYSCNLPSFLNFNIVEELKKRTGIAKIALDNDANCAAKGEAEAGAAIGITNIVNIFRPEILSVGGGISAEGETLLGPVREILEREQYSRFCSKKTVLKKAELGNDAGIIGAALLWR